MRIIASIAFLLTTLTVLSQNEPPEIEQKVIPEYHFTHGFNSRLQHASKSVDFSINTDLITLKQNKIRLGVGLRLNLANMRDMVYTEAHSDLPKQKRYDSLYCAQLQGGSFNLELHGEYYLTKKLAAGLNMDVLGISMSATGDAEYRPTPESVQMRFMPQSDVPVYLTKANAFSLTNAKGSLNTQLYLRYDIVRRISIFGGLGYQLQEVSTDTGFGPNGSYRFQNNGLTWVAGLRFNRFDEK